MTAGRRARPRRRTASALAAVPFVLRRSTAQRGLVAAVMGIVVAGAGLAGTMTLVLTDGQQAAVETTLDRAGTDALAVEVSFRPSTADLPGALDEAHTALTAAVAPFDPVVSSWLTTAVRPLTGLTTHAYVAAATSHPGVELVDGRWPGPTGGAPLEVAIPVVAAEELDLAPGDTLVLEPVRDGFDDETRPGRTPQRLVVVGTYDGSGADPGWWAHDLLRGAGRVLGWRSSPTSDETLDVVGPFLADADALVAAEPAVVRATLAATPGTLAVGRAERTAVRADLAHLVREVRDRLGDRASAERVDAPLAHTLADVSRHTTAIGSVILVVALLGTTLAAAALVLTGRLVAVRRAPENGLLATRGARRGQLVGRAAAEALAIALVGSAVAVPLALVLHAGVRRSAGLGAGRADVTSSLLAVVGLGALVLAALLVAPSWRAAEIEPRGRRSVRARVARLTVDAALLAVSVVAFLQLRSHQITGAGGADPVLVVAPTSWLLAGAVVGIRLVPWVARRAELRAPRSRRLIVPLATWQVARRPQPTGVALLLVLAAAATTFTAALDGAWALSVREQGETRIGAELEVARTDDPPLAQAHRLAETTGGTVLPVLDREVVLGTPGGRVAPGTRLLAFDTESGGGSLRSRLPGDDSWPGLLAGLAPSPAPGFPVVPEAGAVRLSVTGGAEGEVLEAVPSVVVQAAGGATATLVGEQVLLDGTPHTVAFPVPPGVTGPGAVLDVIAFALDMAAAPDPEDVELDQFPSDEYPRVWASVSFPAPPADGAAADVWTGVITAGYRDLLREATLTTTVGADDVTLEAVASVHSMVLAYMEFRLLLTAGAVGDSVPVLISAELAGDVAAAVGDRLALDLEGIPITVRVVGVLPALAALPHGASIVADVESLTRATFANRLDADLTDLWWVTGVPDPDAAAREVVAAQLGEAGTRASAAAAVTDDPLQSLARATLRLLVVAAVALALAGTAAQVAATVQARAVDVARLLGMGVAARAVATTLVLEHVLVSAMAIATGVGVGAVGARFVAPLLVVAPDGAPPVPTARPVWEWTTEIGLVAVLFAGCAAVATPVAARLVGRARATHLRMEAQS